MDNISTDVGQLRGAVSRLERCLENLSVSRQPAEGSRRDGQHPQAGGDAGPTRENDAGGLNSADEPGPTTTEVRGGGATGGTATASRPVDAARRPRKSAQLEVDNVYSLEFLRRITQVAQAYYLLKKGLNGKESIDALRLKASENRGYRFADRDVGRQISFLQVVMRFVETVAEDLDLTIEEAILYTEKIKAEALKSENAALRSFIDICPTAASKKRKAAESTSTEEETRGTSDPKRKKKAELADLMREYSQRKERLGRQRFTVWLQESPDLEQTD